MADMTPDEAHAFAERLLTPTVQAGEVVRFELHTRLPGPEYQRGDRVRVSGTVWQVACETAIIELDTGGLAAVPAEALRPEADA